MATVDWPWNLATIRLADYAIVGGPPVRRTPFESGISRQARVANRAMKERTFQIDVKESNLVAFRAWLSANAHAAFNYRDFEDGEGEALDADATRDCTIVGGARAVELKHVEGQRLDGERFWRADVTLEGFE